VNVIVDAVRVALERTAAGTFGGHRGSRIRAHRGGSMLKNSTSGCARKPGCRWQLAEDPLSSVVLGAGKMLSDFNLLRKISID